jgi:Integrase zinc binding domain
MKKGYRQDSWCKSILKDLKKGTLDEKLQISMKNSLLFTGRPLIVPRYKHLHEDLFRLAHDNLGHFGSDKSYASLLDDFYWPHMRKNLIEGYVPSSSPSLLVEHMSNHEGDSSKNEVYAPGFQSGDHQS